jgi:hypothetical protein
MGEPAQARQALLSALQSLCECPSHQCITETLLFLLARLKESEGGPKLETGRDLERRLSSLHSHKMLSELGERAAITLLTIGIIDYKAKNLPDALTHTRRAHDMLKFGSEAVAQERDRAHSTLLSLQSALDPSSTGQEGPSASSHTGEEGEGERGGEGEGRGEERKEKKRKRRKRREKK